MPDAAPPLPKEPIEDGSRGALLATLRAALPEREEPLLGWGAIRDFVIGLRVTTREGFAPSIRSLRRWRRTRAFPAHPLPGKRGVVWSTGYPSWRPGSSPAASRMTPAAATGASARAGRRRADRRGRRRPRRGPPGPGACRGVLPPRGAIGPGQTGTPCALTEPLRGAWRAVRVRPRGAG